MPDHSPRTSHQLALSGSLLVIGSFNLLTLFAIYWIVLINLGAGTESDAFFVALVLPQLVITVAQPALTHVLIPVLAVGTPSESRRDGWTFLQGAVLVFGAIALSLFVSSSAWVPWLAPGFSNESLTLTVSLVHIALGAMLFAALRSVCTAIFYARNRFIAVEAAEAVAGSLALVLLFAMIDDYGVFAAAWAVAVRYAVQVIVLIPGVGPYSAPLFTHENIRTAWSRAWPLLAGSSYTKLDMVVDRVLASMAGAGLLSLLNVAQQLYGAGNVLIYKASSATAFARLSQLAAAGEWTEFRRLYRTRLGANAFLSISAILVLMLIGQSVLGLVLGHGKFSANDVHQLWTIMLLMFGLLVAGSMGQIVTMAFYATGDTRKPAIIGVAGFTIGLLLKVGGYYILGVLGIAAATTVYYLITLLALEVALVRKLHVVDSHQPGRQTE